MYWKDELLTKWMAKNPLRAYKGKSEPAPQPVKTPKPVNSEVWDNGVLRGKTTLTGGVQKQESFLTPFEQEQQKMAQGLIPSIQQKMFNPTLEMKDSWQTMANATKDNQMKAFNEDYGKAQDSLIQNISSRGLQGSSAVPYMTNELAKTGANQLDTINNNFTSNLQNYELQDFNKNSQLYNILNGGLADQLQTSQNNFGNANTGFQLGNNFNMQNAQMQNQANNLLTQLQYQNYMNDRTNKAAMISAALGSASDVGSAYAGGGA